MSTGSPTSRVTPRDLADALSALRERPPLVQCLTNIVVSGCALSSAVAALRPQRDSWLEAALDAKAWLTAALVGADRLEIGQGHGPVHHFHEIWDR